MSTELAKSAPVSEKELTMHLENMGLMKDLTEGEKNTFLQIAKAFNLNPFKREIYVSKYNGQMSIITGYETYIKRAERSGVLDGWGVKTQGSIATNDLKAIITIYRKDRSRPFEWEALYSEYVQKTKEGNVNKFWQKAETMIKKVAMAQGFRLCFNDELGGMPYSSEELDTPTEDTPSTNTAVPNGGGAPAVPMTTKKPLTIPQYNATVNRVAKGDLAAVMGAKNASMLTDAQITELAGFALKNALPRIEAKEEGIVDILRGYTLNDGATSPYNEAEQNDIETAARPF